MSNKYLNFSDFTPLPPTNVHHIIWNILLTDKLTKLTPDIIQENKIKHILAILPHTSDFDFINSDIKHVSFDVLEYGDSHTTDINFEQYKTFSNKIDYIAKNNPTGDFRNVLIFCNNGYQRSIPFIIYYLTTFHPDEIPSIDKGVDLLLSTVDKQNYVNIKDNVVNNIKQILVNI